MKKICLFFVLISLSFTSCLFQTIEKDKVISYMEDAYNDTFTYDSDELCVLTSKTIYKLKSKKLKKYVLVKVGNNNFGSTDSFISNYIPLMFEDKETVFLESFFKNIYPDCKIIIDNSNVFINSDFYEQHGNSFDSYISDYHSTYLSELQQENRINIIIKDAQNPNFTNVELVKSIFVDIVNKNLLFSGNIIVLKDDTNLSISGLSLKDLPLSSSQIKESHTFSLTYKKLNIN